MSQSRTLRVREAQWRLLEAKALEISNQLTRVVKPSEIAFFAIAKGINNIKSTDFKEEQSELFD